MIARFAAVAAVIILAAGCTSAASHAPAGSTSARTTSAKFDGAGLTFSYPANWQAATWTDDVSENSWEIVSLSTTKQQDPCDSSLTLGLTKVTTVCQQPVVALPPGRMLVMWSEHGLRNWHKPLPTTLVSGRLASETFSMASWCKSLGGTETITLVIPRSLTDNWYQMDACMRGPDLTASESQIAAMLSSLQIAHGW